MNNDDQIQQVEMSLEEARRIQAFRDAIFRLERNSDYKTVITDGYFRDEALRLVMISGEFNLSEKAQEAVINDIKAISSLAQFLRNAVTAGSLMDQEVKSYQETLDEIREEQTGEGE